MFSLSILTELLVIFLTASLIVYLYSSEEEKSKYYRAGILLCLFAQVIILMFWLGKGSEYAAAVYVLGYFMVTVRWLFISKGNAGYLILCFIVYGALKYGVSLLSDKGMSIGLPILWIVVLMPIPIWFILNIARGVPYRGAPND